MPPFERETAIEGLQIIRQRRFVPLGDTGERETLAAEIQSGRPRKKKLAIGTYPTISLSNARKQRDQAHEQLAAGKVPSKEKQQAKHLARVSAANTFGALAKEFLERRRREGLSTSTADKSDYYISRRGPAIARLPISEIGAADLLAVLRRIEAKGNYETARRVLQLAARVFRYAVATARLRSGPSRDLRGALTAPKPKHYGAIIEAARAGELLHAIDGYDGQALTGLAIQLSAHVFVRPGELRHAEWRELDLGKGLWTIAEEKMKMRRPHHVPLSRQSIELLRRVGEISGPPGYLFASIHTRARQMSENTINGRLRRLGFAGDEMTAHGFRAMASTQLNESGKWSHDAIERAQACPSAWR